MSIHKTTIVDTATLIENVYIIRDPLAEFYIVRMKYQMFLVPLNPSNIALEFDDVYNDLIEYNRHHGIEVKMIDGTIVALYMHLLEIDNIPSIINVENTRMSLL